MNISAQGGVNTELDSFHGTCFVCEQLVLVERSLFSVLHWAVCCLSELDSSMFLSLIPGH